MSGKEKTARAAAGRRLLATVLAFALIFPLFASGLMLPSARAAVDAEGREVFCGMEEHQHGDECYTTVRSLVCGQEETGHRHSDACYTERETLVCGLEECEAHTHGEECYAEISSLVCDNTDPEHTHTAECYQKARVLVCGLKETEGHRHTDECRKTERVLSCGQEEREGHIHSESCWREERVLSCGKAEHTHVLECYSDPSAVETDADWKASVSGAMITGRWDQDLVAVAKTQIGVGESTRNFIVRNGVVQGYTRYGDFMGSSEAVVYGPWCASFVIFCMYYARIKGVPTSANCATWVKQLMEEGLYFEYGEAEPKPGDLMFLYSGTEADAAAHKATHVGIVVEPKENGIVTIEGNVGPVSWREYEYDRTNQILGFGRLPDNPNYITLPGDRGRISFSGVLPENAEIRIRPLSEEEYAGYKLPEGRVYFAFETKVFVDGKEQKTGVAVHVEIEAPGVPQEGLQVFHVRENPQGGIVERWPVELLNVSGDTVSYTEFSLARIIAVAPEPEE